MKLNTRTRILNHREFKSLVEDSRSPCISLLLPTHRTGREQKQDPIRLKNLVDQAEEQLKSSGLAASEVKDLLEPIRELRADSWFWRHQSDGLALFRSPEMFRTYRLPLHLKEHCVVGERFFIKPLLPLLHSGGRFFLLGLSQESARLLEATRDSIHELELPEIPQVVVDGDDESLQFHSQRRGARAGSDEAIFHGHGGAADRTKVDVLNYFQRVNEAVTTVLEGEAAPLVLACVGYLAPIYEQANSYPNLMSAKVPGTPKMWTDDELREHAWKLVESHFSREKRASLEAVQQAVAKGNAIIDVGDAVVAAQQGRIEKLLLVEGQQQWGHIDQQLNAVQLTEHDEGSVELLNHAAAQTLNHGGTVFVVDEIPGAASALAGLTRY